MSDYHMGRWNGAPIKIIEDRNMEDRFEDWSGVRSKARAERRRKRGFPQRIHISYVPKPDIYKIGDIYVMHPFIAAKFYRELRSMESKP